MPRLPKNVYKRGSKFYFRVKMNGREIRQSLGSNLQEARRRAPLLLQSLQSRAMEPEHAGTVAEFADRWLREYLAQRRNQKGQRLVAQRLRDFVLPILGSYQIREVKREHLRALRASMETKGRAAQTVRHVLSDVRCLFRYAVEVGELSESPFRASIMPKIPEEAPKRLSDEEVSRILAATPPKYEVAVRLALLTGLRWGELHCLHRRNVKELPEPHLVIEHTKSGKVRRVPLVPEAVEVLRRERERTSSLFVLGFRAKNPCSFVERIGRKARVRWHFHQLRHTFASRWLERGGSIEMLRYILGHSTVRVTERYGRVSDTAVFAEVKRLGSVFRA
jgi:integrase